MLTSAQILRMSSAEKIGESIRQSIPLVPSNAKNFVASLLKPETLAIISATLIAWVASHAFGIGEIVDIFLLSVGIFTLGFAVFEGASEFYDFVLGAIGAKTNADLNKAAQHFARAVTLLGVSALQAILLKGQARSVIARGKPQVHPRPNVGSPPPAGNQLRVQRPASIPGGSLGDTNAYGIIRVARNQSLSEQRVTLLHELVHRYFSPRTGLFRQLRAELSMSAYTRSAFLRYLEEALAEGYAQLRVHGFTRAIAALRFPLQNGYVTLSEIAREGLAVGTITLGGNIFYVTISQGVMPEDD